MTYSDPLYGQIEINEPVILELIDCPTIQRLKKINQAGYFDIALGRNHSRFSHSVGVYLLLKKHNASLEEQIAGLIHDASHAVFSHVIDYVFEVGSEKEQSHQDNIFNDFVKSSEIPEIFKKYNIDIDFILDDNNFLLKENSLPDLCADRIDYAIRDAINFGELTDGKYLLDNLGTENGRWIFNDLESAKTYANLFLMLNDNYYASLPAAASNRKTGDYLVYALAQGYITKDDLYTTDNEVLEKIAPHLLTDKRLELLFRRMDYKIGFKDNPKDYDSAVFVKSRMVNPLCRHNGELKKLSEFEPEWEEIISKASEPKQYFLKFEE